MCVLYSGIYRVALNLQRKSEEKHRKMASLVMAAGGEVGKLGTGVIRAQGTRTEEDEEEEEEEEPLFATKLTMLLAVICYCTSGYGGRGR